jgi:hypothetical protein
MPKKAPEIQTVQKPVRKIGVFSVLGYLFGLAYILAGASLLFSSFAGGMLLILAGIAIIPKFNVFLLNKFHFVLSKWLRIVISAILLISAAVAMFPYQDFANSMNSNSTQSIRIYGIGDTFIVGSMQLTIPSVSKANKVTDRGDGKVGRVGAIFYIFSVHVENKGKASASFSSSNLKARDENGREFDVGGCVDMARGGTTIGERIEPGLSAEFENCYAEVPEITRKVLLEINEGLFSGTGAIVDLSGAKIQNNNPLIISPKPMAANPSAKNLNITLNSVSFSDQVNGTSGMGVDANAGKIFLIADVGVENPGPEIVKVSGQQFKVKDSDGYAYSEDLAAAMLSAQRLDGNLPSGDKIRGKILFQIPKTAKGLQLIFDTGAAGYIPLKFDIG